MVKSEEDATVQHGTTVNGNNMKEVRHEKSDNCDEVEKLVGESVVLDRADGM